MKVWSKVWCPKTKKAICIVVSAMQMGGNGGKAYKL